jgi:putative membrane protein
MIVILKLVCALGLLALVWHLRGGWDEVAPGLAAAGWGGLAVVTLFHLMPVVLCGLAWRALLPDAPPGATWACLVGRWLRDSVNQLLSFVPLGGEVAGARLLIRHGVPSGLATATTVVDLTAEVVAQALFGLAGVAAWVVLRPDNPVAHWGAVGLAASLPVLAGLVVAQRAGVVRLARLLPAAWKAPELHAGIEAVWASRPRLTAGLLLHLAAWFLATGEAWLALWLMGVPVGWLEVLALESMIFALRSAAFVVPAGLGVQEGGYVLLGAALGLPAEATLAVSLLKRGRELATGLPALLAWQWLGRRFRRRGRVGAGSA